MNILPYVEAIHRQLAVAAEVGGDDTRQVAERLVAAADASIRLTLQDMLAAAAEEITLELAPGSVELRLRGRDPEFVVKLPPARSTDAPDEAADEAAWRSPDIVPAVPLAEGDESAMARINVRMPNGLKARVDQAAAGEGLSVNTWLVRAASAALERPHADPRREHSAPTRGRCFRGWAR